MPGMKFKQNLDFIYEYRVRNNTEPRSLNPLISYKRFGDVINIPLVSK